MKKICVITGTRAEYGLLKPVIKLLKEDKELELKLIVTGMHLSEEFGYTIEEIEKDGFYIDKKIEMLLSSDTPSGILKSMGVELIGFADYFQDNSIDMVVLLGDRYEILMAATAAMIFRIPIAHIHGGELTEGVVDEAIRHSITKMSMLHFASTENYRKRIIQLGEAPDRVFNVGALGVEGIHTLSLLDKEELEKEVGFKFDKPVILVTYHPVTLENKTSQAQFCNLLEVLNKMQGYKIVFTKSNADTEGRAINRIIDEFVAERPDQCVAFSSLGQTRYLSVVKFCFMVVGNSSSGIIEAPSFYIPTVNIGDRQKGRIHSNSVIDCGIEPYEINAAIKRAEEPRFREQIKKIVNPYDKENTSAEILDKIKLFLVNDVNLKKLFYDL